MDNNLFKAILINIIVMVIGNAIINSLKKRDMNSVCLFIYFTFVVI